MTYDRAFRKLVDLYLVDWVIGKNPDGRYTYDVVNPVGVKNYFVRYFYDWDKQNDKYFLLMLLRQNIDRIVDKVYQRFTDWLDTNEDIRQYDDEFKRKVYNKIKNRLQTLLAPYA